MLSYLGGVWHSRYFWLSLVRMDLRQRYRGSFVGVGWSLLQPIAMTIIFCMAFRTVFQADVAHYVPFLLSGMTFWTFVSVTTNQGSQSFFIAEGYIRQHPAPLAIYPLRIVLGCAFHYLVALVVVVATAWYFLGVTPPLAMLSLVPSLLLVALLGWSLATIAGLVNMYFQDAQHMTDIGFSVLFYLTPIMYDPKTLPGGGGNLVHIMRYNPFVIFLDLLRAPLLEHQIPTAATFTAAVAIVAVALTAAAVGLVRCGPRVIFLF